MITRRTASASLLAAGASAAGFADGPARAVAMDGSASEQCRVSRSWRGNVCTSAVTNAGKSAVRLREIILFEGPHSYSPQTRFYGEGFTMLSQTGGTLDQPQQIGGYLDRKHYRIPEPADAVTAYSVAWLSPAAGQHDLMAFTSSRRFVGRFHFRPSTVQVTLDCEGLELRPGETWRLEEFTKLAGGDRARLFEQLGDLIAKNHPRLKWPAPPEGWCSWYCFGPRVTAQQVRDNLEWISKNAQNLRYVQIDDGYQPAMGDWLETGTAFGGDVRAVLKEIKQRGFEPAIWVAPFIAEEKSKLFQQHPEWFMKDDAGAPLASNKVTFGGWRRGPWYALDATQPAVQAHFRSLFRTMNQEWGCTYFKLDANFWGAMHGGRLADGRATRVEAYRRGMQAIVEGAGRSFILGCNHPMWPSLGLIHGSRSSGDISRRWSTVKKVAGENLHRAWQNGRLWWNDPDALVLLGTLPENEFQFHAATTFATGGMLLSGDDLTKMSAERTALLLKLRPTGTAAAFDAEFRVGRMKRQGREIVFLLNWSDEAQDLSFELARPGRVTDFVTGADLGRHTGRYQVTAMSRRSGRVFEIGL
ncbi:MAG: alpha-galactosidase [Acidobacteria bacterium]|nr:alpha-galactosidase [Acidobacteriota bacterium]